MKKLLLGLVVVASITSLFLGCDLIFGTNEETYRFDTTDEEGPCVSLTTNDSKFKAAVTATEWELGECPDEKSLGECGGITEIPKDQAEKFGEGDTAQVELVVSIINSLIKDGTTIGIKYYPESVPNYTESITAEGVTPEAIEVAKEEANKVLTEACEEIGGTWDPNEELEIE